MTDALNARHRAALHIVVAVRDVLAPGHRLFPGRNILVVRAPIHPWHPPDDAQRMSSQPDYRCHFAHLKGNCAIEDVDWSAFADYPEWIVWSGDPFHHQLGAARVLDAIRRSGVESPPVAIAVWSPRARQASDLSPPEPERDVDWDHATELVAAFDLPTPEWIPPLTVESERRFPTPEAARELLDYLPSASDGLTWLERKLLECTRQLSADGERRVRCATLVSTILGRDLYGRRHYPSTWIYWHLHRLQGSHREGERLLDPAHLGPPRARFGAYVVGELGNAVLDGEAHRFDRDHTFDRWLCGTHLSWANDTVWVRDGLEVRRWPTNGVPAKARMIIEPKRKPPRKREVPEALRSPRPDVEIVPGLTRLGRPAFDAPARTRIDACSLSADGRTLWIVYSGMDGARPISTVARRDMRMGAVVDVDLPRVELRQPQAVGERRLAAILPHGAAGGPAGVYIADPDAGTFEHASVRPAALNASRVSDHAISDDGRWLAWSCGMDVVLRDLKQRESWAISHRYPSASNPCVSSDGERMIARATDPDRGEGWVGWRTADRSEAFWCAPEAIGRDDESVWGIPSNDVRRMLCFERRTRATIGDMALPDGEFVRYVHPLSIVPGYGRWLWAGGGELVFEAALGDGNDLGIVAFDPATGIAERLYESPGSARLEIQGVSADGRIVVWMDNAPQQLEDDEPPRSGSRIFVLDRDRAVEARR